MKKLLLIILFISIQGQAGEFFQQGIYEGSGRWIDSKGKKSLPYFAKLTISESSIKAVYKISDKNGTIVQLKANYEVTPEKNGFFSVRTYPENYKGSGACLDHVCQIKFKKRRYGVSNYETYTFKNEWLLRSGSTFRPPTSPNPNLIFTEKLKRIHGHY